MPEQWITKCTDVPQYDALCKEAFTMQRDDKLHLRNLCNDSARCAGLTAVLVSQGFRKMILDYSRHQVTGETLELLFDLADAVGLSQKRESLRRGQEAINTTEDKFVGHCFLRMPKDYFLETAAHHAHAGTHHHHPGGSTANNSTGTFPVESILEQIHTIQDQMQTFVGKVRKGSVVGRTGKAFKHTLVVGVEGHNLATEFVHAALENDWDASTLAQGRKLKFISNIDPVDVVMQTKDLNPEETLVIIISKVLMPSESTLTIRNVLRWMSHGLRCSDQDVLNDHVCAVSTNLQNCITFGIPRERVFVLADWVNPRYSVFSAAGLLPLALQYSFPICQQVCQGAHDMDEHYFHAPLRDNIPILMGLLGVWNSTFLGYTSRAVIAYSRSLRGLVPYLQQLEMESNGKRVALDGIALHHPPAEFVFGQPGSNAHHSFVQGMHQGRAVSADFIGFLEPHRPDMEAPPAAGGELVSSHDDLMSNFFAQPDALAYGKTFVDLIQEGVPDGLREHMVFEGNRPSLSLLLTRLDPYAIGQLIALYEHRTATQGFLWGMNSFDQYGMELGKLLAKHVRGQLSASRRTGASVQGFNLSTSTLLEAYLAHGRQSKK